MKLISTALMLCFVAFPQTPNVVVNNGTISTNSPATVDTSGNLATPGVVQTTNSGNSGYHDFTGKTSGNTVRLTVDDTTPAGSYILPGGVTTAKIPAISGTPATGNCAKWISSTLLGDAGAACGSGGGGSGSILSIPIVGPSAGTWINGTGATLSTAQGGVLIKGANSGGIQGQAFDLSTLGLTTPYTIVVGFFVNPGGMAGIGWRDSTTGKLIYFQVDVNMGINLYNSPTSFGSTYYYTPNFPHYFPGVVWMRISDDGTNKTVNLANAPAFTTIGNMWSIASSSLAADQVFYGVGGAGNSMVSAMWVVSFEVNPSY